MDSTLFTTVGQAYRPATAGNGGLSLAWPRRPSSESNSPAAAPQARILHQGNDVVRIHGQRALQRAVAVVAAIGGKRPRLRLVPVPAEHGRQLSHLSLSAAFGSVSGVDVLGGKVAEGAGAS